MDINREVLKIMVDGGEQVCRHALDKWTSNAYGTSEEVRQEQIAHWKTLLASVRDTAAQIKQLMRNEEPSANTKS